MLFLRTVGCNMYWRSSIKAWLLIFAIHFPFLLPFYFRREEKERKEYLKSWSKVMPFCSIVLTLYNLQIIIIDTFNLYLHAFYLNNYPLFTFDDLHQPGDRVVILANCRIRIPYTLILVLFFNFFCNMYWHCIFSK